MSRLLVKQLVNYRTVIVAIVNAAITWIILIIAPLGLFAVITCTVAVFLSSLLAGWISDRALFSLLNTNEREVIRARRESRDFATNYDREVAGTEEQAINSESSEHQLPE